MQGKTCAWVQAVAALFKAYLEVRVYLTRGTRWRHPGFSAGDRVRDPGLNGLLLELGLDASKVAQKQLGEHLRELLAALHEELRVEWFVWNRQVWTASTQEFRPFPGACAYTDRMVICFQNACLRSDGPAVFPETEKVLRAIRAATGKQCVGAGSAVE